MADLKIYLWRAKWLMLPVFAAVLAVGAYGAFNAPQVYHSTARLMLQAQGGGAVSDSQIEQEIALLKGADVRSSVASRFPLQRLYPSAKTRQQAAAQMGKALRVERPNQGGVFNISYQHRDPATAPEVLNAWIGAYLSARERAAPAALPPPEETDDKSLEAELLQLEADILAFLQSNDIGNYESERDTAQSLNQTLTAERAVIMAALSAKQAQIATHRQQLSQTPNTIQLSAENTTPETLLNLQLEREDLLSRYTEDSRAVQSIDRRIAQVEAFLQAGNAATERILVGPNPVHQDLVSKLNELEGEIGLLSGQSADLEQQLQPIAARLNALNALAPEWTAMQRRRALLETRIFDRRNSAASPTSAGGPASPAALEVRVLEEASQARPAAGVNPVLLVISAALALVAALLVGLVYALSRKGIATPARMARETGVPVVGAIGRY